VKTGGAVFATCTHPVAGSHESIVQHWPSSQLVGPPAWHVPPPQVSPVVQAFPSLHGLVLLVWTQPEDELQVSVVQTLPSSQFGGAPPLQVPPPHVSAVVHAFPSLHGAVLLVFVQPVDGLQESSVHGLLSLQSGAGPPLQVPPPHVSFVVHAFPSSHGLVLFVCTQPEAGVQLSVVQALPSSQAFGVWTHPSAESQASTVQGSPSSQSAGVVHVSL
jgi:hypothetical protein